jgi:hypothetical protein
VWNGNYVTEGNILIFFAGRFLILFREIMAVCSQIHKKHITALSVQNVELFNVKTAVNFSKQQVLNS